MNSRLDPFATLPVYENVLAREMAARPADLAAIGDEETVAARLSSFIDTGIDEVHGVCFGNHETFQRTANLLGHLARANA